MSRTIRFAAAAAALALSATASSAQVAPLTNGRDGSQANTLDSARGFTGINAVAPERELLYHPERAGNAAAALGASADAPRVSVDDDAPVRRPVRHRRRNLSRR